jgi:hypothetical protein
VATIPPYQFRAALEYVADAHYRRESFRDYLARDTIEVSRRGKKKGQVVFRPVNIRPMIHALTATRNDDGVVLDMTLIPCDEKLPKADEVVRTLLGIENDDLAQVRICKTASLTWADGELTAPRPMEKV